MRIVFQSARLYFREFTEDDVALLLDLDSNPNVLKYMHRPVPTLQNVTDELHKRILPHYKLYGYGRWGIYLKPGNTFIGASGLKFLREFTETDMGYQFKEDYWGKGYGYEAAKAVIDYGFESLKLPAIFAKALPANIASWKIMEKCGMQYIGDVLDDDGLTVKKYMICK
jgi:ribosomal-protein-alanine N-acetyltransferase